MSKCDPTTLILKYVKNSWRCYLATIANYYVVCCEAVWSAIIATAWLLVQVVSLTRRFQIRPELGLAFMFALIAMVTLTPDVFCQHTMHQNATVARLRLDRGYTAFLQIL